MKKEVEQCMLDFGLTGDGGPRANFLFPEDFVGFQGHFPGNKILPGICEIQCVLSMIEKWKGGSAVLKEIVLAKFFAPVFPSEELTCEGKLIEESNEEMLVKAIFNRAGKKIAEMKLKIQTDEG